MTVQKYQAKNSLTVGDNLIIKHDVIYMELPNPKGGFDRPRIFNSDRKLLGTVQKDHFYDFEENFTKLNHS